MTKCLVLGVNGQDGSFLAEILTARGCHVWGVGKQQRSRYLSEGAYFSYVHCDLKDQERLAAVLAATVPDEIYHLAAVHGAAGFSYEQVWGDALDVNVRTVHTILEYSRGQNRDIRVFYASSAKVFGTPLRGRISLQSQKRHDCLYSVTKLAAEYLLDYYRRVHGLHICIAYLFNHESVRRPPEYFLPRVMAVLTAALDDRDFQAEVHTLDFYCDWGCAREYMEMAADLIQSPSPQDLIFATGKTLYARDVVAQLFTAHGLDYSKHLVERHPESAASFFQVDIEQTIAHFGRAPRRNVLDVCHDFFTATGGMNVLSNCNVG
ncbi:MAG TPA: GDP-mannose 4,6-dehydratase [Desulfomonilaceae bacterium]|nr:GDP-mannose 4,6-dehydratase [Desulfomonilaceae bacterium]